MEIDMDMNEEVGTSATYQQPAQPVVVEDPNAPKHTIYIRNLNYKIGMNEMRKTLYNEFCQFGKILDIVVGAKRFAIKGQAWIIFDKIEEATRALEEMNGKAVSNRPVVRDAIWHEL